MSLTVYGISDDLVEVEGDIREEFTLVDKTGYLALSDGSVYSIEFSKAGVWRIHCAANLTSGQTLAEAPEGDEDNYTDRLTITHAIDWVVFGTEMAFA